MKKVSGSEVVTTAQASELPLPEGIEEALGLDPRSSSAVSWAG
jgi:hypothetical protein